MTEDPDAILRHLEESTDEYEYEHHIAEQFRKAGEIFEKKGDSERAQQMRYESQLFFLRYLS